MILAGMSANPCVEAHLRKLVEDGFEVLVVKDATAADQHPELGDGYAAALANFGYLAPPPRLEADGVGADGVGREDGKRVSPAPRAR